MVVPYMTRGQFVKIAQLPNPPPNEALAQIEQLKLKSPYTDRSKFAGCSSVGLQEGKTFLDDDVFIVV